MGLRLIKVCSLYVSLNSLDWSSYTQCLIGGICIACPYAQVQTPSAIMGLLREGNARRKTESTDANSQSSRSHAVRLRLLLVQKTPSFLVWHTVTGHVAGARNPSEQDRAQSAQCQNHSGKTVAGGPCRLGARKRNEQYWTGARFNLCHGLPCFREAQAAPRAQKLRDGANINKSLLALANCINALGKQHKRGLAYVPYRNSKLTRLLKEGLSGNSRTAMARSQS